MIRVSLTTLVFIYLAVFLNTIFAIWIWWNWQRKRREQHARRFRVRCTICAFEFEVATGELLPRCPRCGSLNERYKLSAL